MGCLADAIGRHPILPANDLSLEETMFAMLMTGFFGAAVMIGGLTLGVRSGLNDAERPHVLADILVYQHSQAVLQCARTNQPTGCAAGPINLPANSLLPNGDPRRNSFRSHHLGNGLVVSWYESNSPERPHTRLAEPMLNNLLNMPEKLPTGWLGIHNPSGNLRAVSRGIVRGGSTVADTPLPASQISGANVPTGAPVLVSRFRS